MIKFLCAQSNWHTNVYLKLYFSWVCFIWVFPHFSFILLCFVLLFVILFCFIQFYSIFILIYLILYFILYFILHFIFYFIQFSLFISILPDSVLFNSISTPRDWLFQFMRVIGFFWVNFAKERIFSEFRWRPWEVRMAKTIFEITFQCHVLKLVEFRNGWKVSVLYPFNEYLISGLDLAGWSALNLETFYCVTWKFWKCSLGIGANRNYEIFNLLFVIKYNFVYKIFHFQNFLALIIRYFLFFVSSLSRNNNINLNGLFPIPVPPSRRVNDL